MVPFSEIPNCFQGLDTVDTHAAYIGNNHQSSILAVTKKLLLEMNRYLMLISFGNQIVSYLLLPLLKLATLHENRIIICKGAFLALASKSYFPIYANF
jgi:hypothetical protein